MKKVCFYKRSQFENYKNEIIQNYELLSFSWFLTDPKERLQSLTENTCIDLSSFIPYIINNPDKILSFEQLFSSISDSILFICDKQYENDIRYLFRYSFDEFENTPCAHDSVDEDFDGSSAYQRVRKIVDLNEQELDTFFQTIDSKLYGHALFKKEFRQLISSFRVFNRLGEHKVLSLFLMGDSGVGKTEVARSIHKALGGKQKLAKVNFGNYSSHDALNSLIGSPRGYVGSETGELIKRMKDSDVGLILIDEFEKADTPVFNYFLDVLENGKITDSQGEEYDVDGYIIVFTSNMNQSDYQRKISPELKSRLDYKGMFSVLTNEDKIKYLHFRVNQIVDSYNSKAGCELPDYIRERVVKSINVSQFKNMRDLNKAIKDAFVDEINKLNDL